jgi:hypothetical protein
MAESAAGSTGRIFISYRRDETAYPAGWLYDRLANQYGGEQVFKDVDSIELGADFVQVITRAVASCDVLLALIGKQWLTITDENRQRRLDDPDDFVRLEIEAALTRNIRVIPILIDGAKMPRADELPHSLVSLRRRQALELSPSRFEYDTGRLLKVLDTTLAEVRTAQDDAAAISMSAAPQAVQDTAENDVPAAAGTARGVPAGEDPTTPQPVARPLHESTSAHSKARTSDEGRPRKNVGISGRSLTLRRLLMIGVPLATLLAIYLIIQFVLGQPTPPQDSGAQSSATNEFKPSPVALPASEALSDSQLLVARYVDEDWELYRADTRSPRPGARLTNRRGSDTQPVLSPDRRTVIYVHFDENGTASLRVAGAADLNGDRVLFKLPTGCSYLHPPAWNPTDATLLAIGCRENNGPGPTTLRLMRTDGTVVNIVKPPADRPRTGHLAFSADGTRLGFWASSDESANEGRLYTVDVAGGTPEPVFPTQDPAAAHDANLAFSPDGEHIAFTRPQGAQNDIFVAGTDGNDLMPLTSARAVDDSPTWSPDGQWIAFRSAAPTSAWPGKPLRRIWITSSTKDDPRVLWTQDAPEEQRHPTWR